MFAKFEKYNEKIIIKKCEPVERFSIQFNKRESFLKNVHFKNNILSIYEHYKKLIIMQCFIKNYFNTPIS